MTQDPEQSSKPVNNSPQIGTNKLKTYLSLFYFGLKDLLQVQQAQKRSCLSRFEIPLFSSNMISSVRSGFCSFSFLLTGLKVHTVASLMEKTTPSSMLFKVQNLWRKFTPPFPNIISFFRVLHMKLIKTFLIHFLWHVMPGFHLVYRLCYFNELFLVQCLLSSFDRRSAQSAIQPALSSLGSALKDEKSSSDC